MQQLEHPSEETWDERRLWFEEHRQAAASQGVGRLSEQAEALVIEMQTTFCAGAWAATVLLAAAVVDAQEFHRGYPESRSSGDRSWLRGLRNSLLHENRSQPAFTIEDHWTRREEWGRHARRAVRMAFDVLYALNQGGRRK
ncbi:hypothetical protein [Limibacillus halophilus]|uniref:DUF4145 domain-containing protein n=1 Tax=Limibacillus halophilus TaxID=1579333 RepID=A0A839SVG1_9PROT|nr:hypothetical protein [Limibacillus halophilus]MBB3065694.1 hypothetical protein [Limibacillus halophilus]